ncbi:hypothetical protein MY11210_005129 [Beauveria gryllotalpidicola]
MDSDGLVPEDLDYQLRNWDASRGCKPFVLYTIPSGHNPTGITQPTNRKKAIYQVAERHDLLMLEDDPYYFLRLNDVPTSSDNHQFLSRSDKFKKSLPTSYLSLDKSGRVMRVESTSKILAPGLRCGWLTASQQIIDLFKDFVEVGPSSPSGPSQVMLYKLLVENWGQEGFINWLEYLSREYRMRRDAMIAACERYLPEEPEYLYADHSLEEKVEVEDMMMHAIFGSNRIEHAGLNLDITMYLCRKILHGEDVGEIAEQAPQEKLSELYHIDPPLKEQSLQHVLRGRQEIIQHVKAFQHLIHLFAVDKRRT